MSYHKKQSRIWKIKYFINNKKYLVKWPSSDYFCNALFAPFEIGLWWECSAAAADDFAGAVVSSLNALFQGHSFNKTVGMRVDKC